MMSRRRSWRTQQPCSSCTCLAGSVNLNYDTFGDRMKPAVLLIMGLAAQKVRYPDGFCRKLAERGFFVVRFDNRDAGRSSRAAEKSVLERVRSLQDVPVIILRSIAKEHRRKIALVLLLLGAAAWRWGRRRHRASHAAAALATLYLWATRSSRSPYSLQDMAKDCVRLLDSLGVLQAHVVGYSMGGMIAQALAREHPARCRSLVLVSTCSQAATLTTDPGIPWVVKHIFACGRAFDPCAGAEQRQRGIEGFWGNLSAAGDVQRQRRLAAQEQIRGLSDVDAMLRQVMAILRWTDDREAQPPQHPTLVIHGMRDPLIPLSHGLELAKQVQCQRCLVLPDLGHDVLPAACEEVLDATLSHFAQLGAEAEAPLRLELHRSHSLERVAAVVPGAAWQAAVAWQAMGRSPSASVLVAGEGHRAARLALP